MFTKEFRFANFTNGDDLRLLPSTLSTEKLKESVEDGNGIRGGRDGALVLQV